ncbi:MAG: hypothetical protein E6Z83_07920 [Pantoea sp.]|uniref:hypothetical protein n=1 Tax=Pantoea sp. TaxID=69393 RepID=UPI00290E276B|nr:hypothetical protein [Pantoea sp.]MDU5780722.1 hypothetical protein [Pantoea sp.]
MAKRGQLTIQIKSLASELLGKEISQVELRLMPYAQYCLMNGKSIDPQRVNLAEREVISDWRKRGFIEGGASGLGVTKEFWDAINQILWLGYIAYSEQEDSQAA